MKTKHSEPITREKHMAWCKARAMQELEAGRPRMAVASMMSDLGKHPETANHHGRSQAVILLMSGALETEPQVRKFIEGF